MPDFLLMGMTKNHNNPLGEKITIAILKNRLSFFILWNKRLMKEQAQINIQLTYIRFWN